jgi:hypothetical protein
MIKRQLQNSTGASGIEIELKLRRERRLRFQVASAGIAD